MGYRPRYVLPTYNGFGHAERVATNPIQNAALRDGRLIRPDTCSICGFSLPSELSGRGYIYLHLEDYRRPLAPLPVCKRCHPILHARFRDPEPWLRIVRRYWQPGRWFTLLTMAPESQTRPFDETYPDGLPDVWEVWPAERCSSVLSSGRVDAG